MRRILDLVALAIAAAVLVAMPTVAGLGYHAIASELPVVEPAVTKDTIWLAAVLAWGVLTAASGWLFARMLLAARD